LRRAAAAGLALLLPACSRTEPEKASPPATGDFAEGALRLDLRQRVAGLATDFALERIRYEPKWSGRLEQLADGLGWGDYRLSIYDPGREALLFWHGFDTGIDPRARSATTRLALRFPVPRRPVRAAIERRRGAEGFHAVSTFTIDPGGGDIDRSAPAFATRVDTILASGRAGQTADLAILGDGYREHEYGKFVDDARHAAGYLFSVEPFRKRRGDFNVHSVFAASADSGVTDPYLGLSRDTVFRCAYGSGGAERTLAEGNHPAVREVASVVPYDFLIVLANARRYGGSAYFGGPAVVAADSAEARYLVIHELAHAIAGLADEYYIPDAHGPAVFGNVEPWHSNVTISPASGKWGAVPPEPTPWNKAEYERYFADYVRRYERLRERGAEEAAVEKFLETERRRQAALLAKNANPRRAGYYEGANGFAKGAFRAEPDCIMFSLQTDYFCAACSAAIERAIDWHCL
jgi:hypothetical protein